MTTGNNGTCSPSYYCTAGAGYDGPTGLGTPNGVAAFTTGPHGTVTGTITDSATGAPIAGATVTRRYGIRDHRRDRPLHPVRPGRHVRRHGGRLRVRRARRITGVAVTDGASVHGELRARRRYRRRPSPARSPTAPATAGRCTRRSPSTACPVAPVYTNPYTGAYSLTLPAGQSYHLHVTSVYTGYQAVDATVAVGSANVTKNVAVPVDSAACDAPGYGVVVTGTQATFDGTSTPTGWTVVNNTAAGGWEFDDPGNRDNLTGGSGDFAIVDSDSPRRGQHRGHVAPDTGDQSDRDHHAEHRLRHRLPQPGIDRAGRSQHRRWHDLDDGLGLQRRRLPWPGARGRPDSVGGEPVRGTGPVPLHRHLGLVVGARQRVRRQPFVPADARRPRRRYGD